MINRCHLRTSFLHFKSHHIDLPTRILPTKSCSPQHRQWADRVPPSNSHNLLLHCTFYPVHVYTVQCTMYSVHCVHVYNVNCKCIYCTLYPVHMYSVQSTLCTCTLYSVQYKHIRYMCTLYNIGLQYTCLQCVQCKRFSVHCTLYNVHTVQCTRFTVHCTVNRLHCTQKATLVDCTVLKLTCPSVPFLQLAPF